MKFISFIILFASIKCSCCEFFSSIEELKNLEKNERKLINLLKDFAAELDSKSLYVKKFLNKLEDEHGHMTKDVDKYLKNPLNSYTLIQRLSNDIQELNDNFKFVDEFLKNSLELKLPSSELNGAIEGLYRLQKTYDLKSEDFLRGIIDGEQFGKQLSAHELLIAAQGLMTVDKNYAYEYIKIAKESILKFEEDSKIKFLEQLFDIYNSKLDHELALQVLDEIREIDITYPKYDEKKKELKLTVPTHTNESASEDDYPDELLGSYWTPTKENLIFTKACQQKLSKSAAEMSKLHCRYISKTFFTKIAPFKIMEANLDPYMVIYVDIISDKEIELLKGISRNNMQRAAVAAANSTFEVSKNRIAKLSWPEESKHKILQTLNNRVNDMTGLSMTTAENWQIQNYGIGGFYSAHHDFANRGQTFNDNTGNRIATMLFYLSDVEKGGGTAFPFLRIYVQPKKGTAAFWYNLSTSGNREYLSLHTACPVLVGSKWVANKWIRERGQELTRPCEPEPKPTEWDFYLKKFNLNDYRIKI